MRIIKILLVLLALQIAAFMLVADRSRTNSVYDMCEPTNDWHWSTSQDDATGVVNCPMQTDVAEDIPQASGESIMQHHALQIMAVTIPVTTLAALAAAFRAKQK